MATYQELRTRSQQVRDEQNIGGNTALRVGQLLMDIVKYFNDNDAAASEYLQQHFAMVNDGTHLLNWQQSPIVILHTMGDDYDDGDSSALSHGENYYHAGFIMEANGQGGGIKGETPKANVLYVNLANGTLYTWNGSSFDAISSGGGGGSISGDDILKNAYYLNGNLVLVFDTENGDKTVSIPVNFDASNYVPTSRTVNGKALSNNITLSQSDIPGLVAALAAKVGYSDDEWLQVKAGAMQAATAVPNTTTVNGKRLNDNITIGMSDIPGLLQAIANAGSGAVSVTTNQDGTFVIHVGETDYTINLNHTHENMAKLVVCEESDLPSTLDNSTIYAITDSGETEIEKLIIRGMEFAGGGVPAGTPAITKPSGTTINLGENSGSGVSKSIEIRANSHITGDLTVGLAANSNLSFDTSNLPSGVTYNSGAGTLTIAQATAIQGVNITVVYSGSGAAEIDGGLVISGGGATPKSVVVVVALPQPIGVKLTGTQWLQTDYYPNANTEFELVCKFTDKGNTSMNNGYFLTCANNTDSTEKFQIAFSQDKYKLWHTVKAANFQCLDFSASADQANFVLDNSVLSFVKGASSGTFKFVPGGDESKAKSIPTPLMNYSMQNPLRIGRGNTYFFALFELTIYELTITENGTAVRHYVPKIVNGVPGLYDTVTDTFISSETSTEVEEVYANS